MENFNPKARAYFDEGDVAEDQQEITDPGQIRAYVMTEELITSREAATAFADYLYQAWNEFDDSEDSLTNEDVLFGGLSEWIDQHDVAKIQAYVKGGSDR